VSACLYSMYMNYAYTVHVVLFFLDTRRRRRPYGVAVGGRPNVVNEVGQVSPAAPPRQHGDAFGACPVVGDGVGHHDRRAGGADASGDIARDGVAGADSEQEARRASGWSWRRWHRRGAGSASRKWLVVAAVVQLVEKTSQLVHVPSSATASGITTGRRRRRLASRPTRRWCRRRWGRCA